MKRTEFTQEEINTIIKLYEENNTQKAIGEKLGVGRGVISRVLKENQVKIRQTTSKYYADYDIFENIDNPEKAYWLGFLAANGCNYQREHNASIIINIHQKDINHLEKFKSFCKTNAEIKEYIQDCGFSNNTPMCKIILNSKKMSQDLIDKGIIPNKSLVLQKPNIQEEYYLPFILGYFDGDGSINKASQYNNYELSIVGTKEMLEWINELLKISDSNNLEKRNNDNKNNYYIRCGGVQKVYNIMKKLYDSCEIHLDRKYIIFKALETVVLSRNAE